VVYKDWWKPPSASPISPQRLSLFLFHLYCISFDFRLPCHLTSPFGHPHNSNIPRTILNMRLSYFLLAPILALQASAQLTPSTYGIEGCVNVATVLGLFANLNAGTTVGLRTPTTQEACADACQTANRPFAYYFELPLSLSTVLGTASCVCSNREPALSALVGATTAVSAAAGAGICGQLNAQAIRVTTNFNLRACAAADAFTSTSPGTTTTAGSVGDCLTRCSASVYAIVNTLAGTCTCASNAQLNNNAVLGACATAGNNNAIYLNTGAAQPSGGLRKRSFERQKTLGLCPTGLQACLVGDDSAVGVDAFECLDTRAELESCGGCTNGYADITTGANSVGVDCSSLPGVALGGATCTLGKCEIFACKKGHNFVNGRCLRA